MQPDGEQPRSTFALRARGIRKSFGGVEVLHGIDLDVVGGSVVALLGENGAGKSTLVRMLAGDHAPDAGEITIGDRIVAALDPVSAIDAGIRMIYQELNDAPPLTVAENVALGRWPSRRGFVSWSAIRGQARRMLDDLGVDIDVDRPVSSLRIGERQIVEIARALSADARCLILDEPTAALSDHEVEALFRFVRTLRDRGVAIVYITHRLDEVFALADEVRVLRDGYVALAAPTSEVDRPALVAAMVGRELGEIGRPAPSTAPRGKVALRMVDATLDGVFAHLDLEVATGEVVALYGKLGSGAFDVGETVFGLHKLDGGQLEIEGKAVRLRGPSEAIDHGIGLLPADRKREGAFLTRSVAENLAVSSWSRLARRGLITRDREAAAYQTWHERLRVRSRNDPQQPIGTLSGGNQQKVLLGRWLERGSRILVLIEPTRGVDVGAREEIYRVIRSLAAEGVAVLVCTSDNEEVVQLADRAVVLSRGTATASMTTHEISTQRLVAAAA